MRTRTATWWTGFATVMAVTLAAPVGASADDQATLDVAIESFNERMIAAGWQSQGPSDGSLGADDEDDESSESDDQFDECFGNFPDMFAGLDDGSELPGETARSTSDDFTFTPPGAATETTENMFAVPDEEEAAAIAFSVDDAHVAAIGEFVEVLGSKETSECLKQAMEADMTADSTSPTDIPLEFEIEASTQGDLGVGDQSAELSFSLSMDLFGTPFTGGGSMVFASAGNHLVGVMHFTTGEAEPTSGFEALVELQTLVDAVTS